MKLATSVILILSVKACFVQCATKISAQDLAASLDEYHLVDIRSKFERESEGLISGSIYIPLKSFETDIKKQIRLVEQQEKTLVLVANSGEESKEAENIVKGYGLTNFRCYLDGMDQWRQANEAGFEFPRFISFPALSKMLKAKEILLIDVRNRTELNTVGQIPGSVCLPLHEVRRAFQLEPEEFMERYEFAKPVDKQRKDIVLTCRSGRRVLVADRILRGQGYPNLRIYSGSFKDWKKRGGDIIDGEFDLDYQILN